MSQTWNAVRRAAARWYQESFEFILLNIGWLILQIPLITGPAATAAMYATAQRALHGESVSIRTAVQDAQRLFSPSLKWGTLNLLIGIALAVNFIVYAQSDGMIWSVLRALWAGIGIGWFVLNTFYWPFWLEQNKPTLRQTLFNCLLFVVKRPIHAITSAGLTLILILVSMVLTLPLGAGLMSWVALIGTATVDQELAMERAGRIETVEVLTSLRK
jgi:uncharacterized membrane protein YesL